MALGRVKRDGGRDAGRHRPAGDAFVAGLEPAILNGRSGGGVGVGDVVGDDERHVAGGYAGRDAVIIPDDAPGVTAGEYAGDHLDARLVGRFAHLLYVLEVRGGHGAHHLAVRVAEEDVRIAEPAGLVDEVDEVLRLLVRGDGLAVRHYPLLRVFLRPGAC